MKKKRLKVYCYDRNVISNEINSYKDINLTSNLKRNYYDGILILVPHKHIKDLGEKKILNLIKKNGFIFDFKNTFKNLNLRF